MTDSTSELVRLLRNDTLVWSDELDAIRKPLADLLVKIDQSPSHQFDDEVDAIVSAFITPTMRALDPFEHWLTQSLSSLGDDGKAVTAFKRLFGK